MEKLALDAAGSKRWKDPANGYLHVRGCVLTKSAVDPYLGREISGAEALRLDPDKRYLLYRPAEELAKAAATANGIPLLNCHDGNFDAVNYDAANVIGAIGTDARFDDPYLVASLAVYDSDVIAEIEAGERVGLSCGYAYRPVVEGGMHDGVGYDLKMTDIRFNHVALVKEGRVGPEAKVADSKEELTKPTKGEFMPNQETEEEPVAILDDGIPDTDPAAGDEGESLDAQIAVLEEKLRLLRERKAAAAAGDLDAGPGDLPGKAMDSASLFAAVEKRLARKYAARDDALDAVRPLVGELRISAMDSAETVYRYALSAKNITVPEGINLIGLRGMVDALLAVSPPERECGLALDSGISAEADEIFRAAKVRVL